LVTVFRAVVTKVARRILVVANSDSHRFSSCSADECIVELKAFWNERTRPNLRENLGHLALKRYSNVDGSRVTVQTVELM
jgi:hypothetical protein